MEKQHCKKYFDGLNVREQIECLFAILDAFNRDSLYTQCDVKLCFQDLAGDFLDIFEQINTSSVKDVELAFDDYKDQITRVHVIPDSEDHAVIKTNSSKSADVNSTLLFFATSQPIPVEKEERNYLQRIIECLVFKLPSTITYPMKGANDEERRGPSPLHVMIVKEAYTKAEKKYKFAILEAMLFELNEMDKNNPVRSKKRLHMSNLSGEMARGSILRGKTILNIAARTLDQETIKFLLLGGVCFDSRNVYKDNMYHSLIRYALFFPDKEDKIKKTMEGIEKFLNSQKDVKGNQITQTKLKCESKYMIGFPERLWSMKNKEGLTPLQLAAKLGRFKLFEFIIRRKVYQINDRDKGNFDDDTYDVTEIDTVPVTRDECMNTDQTDKEEHVDREKQVHRSVLHLLIQQPSNEMTNRFVGINVVSKTISQKWEKYRVGFWVWGFLHFLIMCLYSWQAIVRSQLDNPVVNAKRTSSYFDNIAFVIVAGGITTLYGVLCFVTQCMFCIHYGLKHRGTVLFFSYGHVFLLQGICMCVDYICMLALSNFNNVVLPFTIIIGWYLMVYFLHVVERFSFFTVLIKNVVGDLLQFGIVMLFLLIGFSVAMYVVMQGAEESDEDDFRHVGKTFVKMFTVMLGIGEINVLFNARYPILAVVVFVLFVLMTTILLLNALIAIMSNTCSALTTATSSKAYVRLQRLSTIINLEAMLPNQFIHPAAEEINRIWPGKNSKTRARRILSLRPEGDEDSKDLINVEEGTSFDMILPLIAKTLDTLRPKRKRRTKPTFSRDTQTEAKSVQEDLTLDIVSPFSNDKQEPQMS